MAIPKIHELEGLIRHGNAATVRTALKRLRLSELDREKLAPLASMARRSGLPEMALRILHPVIRPDHPLPKQATAAEAAIYASALARIGAFEEAVAIFSSLRERATAEVAMLQGFVHIQQWDYAAAIPHFKSFLSLPGVNDYDRLVGQINLAACYQFLGTHEREKQDLLRETLRASRENSWVKMECNSLELSAQAALTAGEFTEASRLLERAAELSPTDDLWIAKWQAVVALNQQPDNAEARSQLLTVRSRAVGGGEREIVRDCDYYMAMNLRDQKLATHVYFGTWSQAYRQRLKHASRAWLELPNTYDWSSAPDAPVLDLVTGQIVPGGNEGVKPGQAISRLLQLLASDFYRAFHIGTLFMHLYPQEVFSVESSPSRVRRVVDRLRQWIREGAMPLSLENQNGTYWLEFTGPFALRVSRNIAHSNGVGLLKSRVARLRECFGHKPFSSKEAALAVGLSLDRAREMLKDAVAAKKLLCTGQGRATRFRFAKGNPE